MAEETGGAPGASADTVVKPQAQLLPPGAIAALQRGDVGGILVAFGSPPSADGPVRALAQFAVEQRRGNVATIGQHEVFYRAAGDGQFTQVIAPVRLSIHDGTLYRIPDRWECCVKGTNGETRWDKDHHKPWQKEFRPVYKDASIAKLTAEGFNRVNAVAGCSVQLPPQVYVDGKAVANPHLKRDEHGDLRHIDIGVQVAGPAPITGNIVVVQYLLSLDVRADLNHMLLNLLKGRAWENQKKGAPKGGGDAEEEDAIDVSRAASKGVHLVHQNAFDRFVHAKGGDEPWRWHWIALHGGVGLAHDLQHSDVQAAYDKYQGILDNIVRKAMTVARRNAMRSHPALAVQTVRIDNDGCALVRGIGWAMSEQDIRRYAAALDALKGSRHAPGIELVQEAHVYDAAEDAVGDAEIDAQVSTPPEDEATEAGPVAEGSDTAARNDLLRQIESLMLSAAPSKIEAARKELPGESWSEATAAQLERAVALLKGGA